MRWEMLPPIMETGCGVGLCKAITGNVIFLCLCQGKTVGLPLENTVLNKRGTGKLKTRKKLQRSHSDVSGEGCKFTTQHLLPPSPDHIRDTFTLSLTHRVNS